MKILYFQMRFSLVEMLFDKMHYPAAIQETFGSLFYDIISSVKKILL